MSSRFGAPQDHARNLGSTRREFLRHSATAIGGLALPGLLTPGAIASLVSPRANKSVIFVHLDGGPSHLDMYDMKPESPAEIRGEFRPIETNVPGIRVCEHLPLHAKIADKFAIVNGVETIDSHGPAVIVTGSAASQQRTGVESISGVHFEHLDLPHGDWDTHGRVLGRQLTIFQELRDKLPAYDAAIHRLITDVYDRGLDKDVLLVACGEFGRTPWINEHGGRNHWAPCGSVLFAGGGLKLGQVIGDTGTIGERDRSRSQPYTAQNVLATIYRHLGIDPSIIVRKSDGQSLPLLDDPRPIGELI
jgi:hypothetical protein